MMYIKYIAIQLLFLISYLLGLIIVPFLYPFRKNGIKIIKPFWYFLNDTPITDNDGGDYGRFKHNLIGFYKQNAIRNSHWNLKLLLAPKIGIKENVVGNLFAYNVMKPYKFGCNFATYSVGGTKYFRFSFTKEYKYFVHNMQIGALDIRFAFKNRIHIK